MSLILSSSGGGSVTLQEPTTASSRTLTLPDVTGTVAHVVSNVLPAYDGSALTGVNSFTLLGTLTTTSGASQSLTGLTLTSYKALCVACSGVSHNNGSNSSLNISSTTTAGSGAAVTASNLNSTATIYSVFWVDLATGAAGSGSTSGQSNLTTASTSVNFVWSTSGPFDAGTIKVYGVA